MDLRLPRVLTAMLVGLALAVAGVTFQGLLRNPLADPYVLGTSAGAALGAAIAVLIPVRIVILELGLLQAFAFVRGAARDLHGLQAVPHDRSCPADEPAPDRVRGRVAAGRRARDGDVPVGRPAPTDLHVPARQLRRRELDPPRLGAADCRDRDRRNPAAGPDAQRAAARGGDRSEPRRQRRPRARDPARSRLTGHRRGRRDQRPDRVRRTGRAARRSPRGRALGAPGPAAFCHLRGRPHGIRGPCRAAPGRDPGRRRHRGDRRAILPVDPAPRPGGYEV